MIKHLIIFHVIFTFYLCHGLGLSQLLGGLKGSSSSTTTGTAAAGSNNMILCTIRHSVHYATVYDTVLIDKVQYQS